MEEVRYMDTYTLKKEDVFKILRMNKSIKQFLFDGYIFFQSEHLMYGIEHTCTYSDSFFSSAGCLRDMEVTSETHTVEMLSDTDAEFGLKRQCVLNKYTK